MKRKAIFFIAALSIMLTLSGCGKVDVEQPYDYDLSEYVTLGEYKGIEVLNVEPQAVTDEDVLTEITYTLSENPITQNLEKDSPLESGDTVNIDYVGRIDGEEFDNGSAKGYDLILGSGQFIAGFEDGLIGVNVGDTKVLNLTFPEENQSAEVAGKAVEFTVTVNSAKREVAAELNDEFVKTVSDVKTVDEYKQKVKENLEKQAEESAKQAMKSAAWKTVVENAEIKSYPEKEVQDYITEMTDYYKQYGETYGMEFADVLESMGMTQDEFDEQSKTYAESMVGDELVLYSIIHTEDISLSQKEYEEGAQKYLEQYGYDKLEDLEAYFTKETVYESLLWDKTLDFLLENAKVVDQLTPVDTNDTTTGGGVDADNTSDGAVKNDADDEGTAE